MLSPACPPSTPSIILLALVAIFGGSARVTNQSLHRSVQRMSVVSSEFGVGAFQGWISHGLWLLDTVRPSQPDFLIRIAQELEMYPFR
jgi:hypothetical protein